MSKKINNHDCRKEKCTSKINFFQFLDDKDQIKILEGIEHYVYAPGEKVLEEGQSLDYIAIIEDGRAKLNRYDNEGVEHILGFLNPGDIIGDQDIFGDHIMESNAFAISPLKICRVRKKTLASIMSSHPEFSSDLLSYFSDKIRSTNNKVWILLSNNSLEIIAKFLLDQGKDSANIELTIDDIASAINLRRETVSRRLSLLQKYKVIKRKGYKQIQILNYDDLELIAFNDYDNV